MSIAVISHDQGGAEILSRWVKINPNNYNFSLDGPAKKVFKTNFGYYKNLEYKEAILKSKWVICSTGWQSELEKKAVKFAKKNKIKVVSFLDHWVNYKERFLLDDNYIFPDEIWVCDKYAYVLAKNIFKNINIVLKRNYYLENIYDELKKEKKFLKNNHNENSVLYLGENIAEHNLKAHGNPNYLGYTEKHAFSYFLQNINLFPKIEKIIVRPHPSEDRNYEWAKKLSCLVQISPIENTLLEDILGSETIIGCESMALVISIMASKRVISIIPPEGRKCVLPHKEILHLSEIQKDQTILKYRK